MHSVFINKIYAVNQSNGLFIIKVKSAELITDEGENNLQITGHLFFIGHQKPFDLGWVSDMSLVTFNAERLAEIDPEQFDPQETYRLAKEKAKTIS